MYFKRSGRPHVPRPPEPSIHDHRIGQTRGSTAALDMTAHRLSEAKKEPSKPVQQQLYDAIQENGCLRQEAHFYRTCADKAQVMQACVREVAQKMMLSFLLEVEATSELQTLARQLQHTVDEYRACVDAAEEERMSFWGIDRSPEPSGAI